MVSILVTVYNRAQVLEQTLQSIVESHYDDFEVVVVDDCSTDPSYDIAMQFAAGHSRVTVHKNASNLGDYPNRARAASLAKGHYIKFVDSDDLIYPHSLGVMVTGMQRYPEAALGLSHSMPEDNSPYPWCLAPREVYRKHFLERGCLSCGPSGAIIRREALGAIGGFRPEWKVIADIDAWYRLAARWPVVLLPPALVWWRRHEGQEFVKGDAAGDYLQKGFQLNMGALGSPECPLLDVDRSRAIKRCKQHHARRLLSLALRQGQPGQAWHAFRSSDLNIADLAKGLGGYA